MRRIRKRSLAVALGLLGGAGLALTGTAPTAVGNYTYEPGPPCAVPSLGTPQNGLTNMGFETGNFSAWTVGTVADDAAVTGADGFAAPNEGRFMARLGSTYSTPDERQPPGRNEICQDFKVDQPFESFAYRILTWDGDGFDHFQYRVVVVNPTTGEILAHGQGGGWDGFAVLKDSGWQQVSVDLRGHVGETVRIYFEAGATQFGNGPNNDQGTWAYLDDIRDDAPKSILLRAKPKKVKKGKRTNLIATVAPCPESIGDMVSFFRKNKQIGVIPADGGCTASLRVRITKTRRFFATVPTDQDRLGGTSNTVRVKVKKPN